MSAGASLRARVNAARSARYIDLPVPDVEGVFVRYRALPADRLEAAAKRNRNRRDVPAVLGASLDVLVDACLGVWEADGDGGRSPVEGYDGELSRDESGRLVLKGELPTFGSPELGEALGATEERAAAVVLALYIAEGDVIGTADAVVTHSGASGEELLSEARGH